MSTIKKTCFKCGAEKPLTEYYKAKGMRDGHFNKCKECTKKDVKHHYYNVPGVAERYRAKQRAKKRGTNKDLTYQREYRKRNKVKTAAQQLVSRKLTNPGACEECESTRRIEGHHDDYSKPLDVRWLCAVCHKQWHAANGPGKF